MGDEVTVASTASEYPLVKEVLGGKYEFMLAIHIDKDYAHNYLIFNAISFTDYKHYHSNKRIYHEIHRTSQGAWSVRHRTLVRTRAKATSNIRPPETPPATRRSWKPELTDSCGKAMRSSVANI